MIIAIVAMDRNNGIGYKSELLYKIPADLKYFKCATHNNVVIMGRKTFESLPEQKPLPKRRNVVLTRNPRYKAGNAIVLHNAKDVIKYALLADKDSYVIGGGEVYKKLLPYCSKILVTEIDAEAPQVDTYFPHIENDAHWNCTSCSKWFTYGDTRYRFKTYLRNI